MNSKKSPVDPLERRLRMLVYETDLWAHNIAPIAGIDEAGRGPLAGPVVAAAVMFDPGVYLPGVDDSKLLDATEREIVFQQIVDSACGIGIGIVNHTTIDEINILNATYRAMHEAVSKLPVVPRHLLVDGNRFAGGEIPFTTVIDGDACCFSIAAASIIAKVTRDRIMVDYDAQFPGYGFARHKGYATREHRDAIVQRGFCEIHRRSFELKNQLELEFVD